MPADEVVTEQVDMNTVSMGHLVVPVSRVEISPINERPLTQGLELRRTDNPAFCYIQIGPMRYVVETDAFVIAVNRTFPFEAAEVLDSRRGKFEMLTERAALFEAVQRAFLSITQYAAGNIPRRLTGPLDLLVEATNTSAELIAEYGQAFGCEVVVDPLCEGIIIDYGPTGFPFSVTVRLATASS